MNFSFPLKVGNEEDFAPCSDFSVIGTFTAWYTCTCVSDLCVFLGFPPMLIRHLALAQTFQMVGLCMAIFSIQKME